MPPLRLVLLVVALVALGLASLPMALTPRQLYWVLREDGPVEALAAGCWFVLACVALARTRPPSPLMVCYALVFAMLGARELGLDGHISGGGRQAVRLAYYLGDAPLIERATVAVALAAALIALVGAAWGTLMNLRRPHAFARAELNLLLLGGALVVASQVFEQAIGWISPTKGEVLPLARSFWALEEGFETLAPIVMGIGLWPRGRARAGAGRLSRGGA